MTYITDIKQAQTVLTANELQLITFDHNIRYDNDLSQIYFDEFISNASGCNEVQLFDSYLVIYGDNVSKDDIYYKRYQLEKMRKDDLIELCETMQLYLNDDMLKSDYIDELMTIDNEQYYQIHYAESYYNDLDYDFSFNGYSQGDYYKVKTIGKMQKWINSEYLTNIFYDAPITGVIEIDINGVTVDEINLYDFMQDEYAYWDKDEFIKQLAEYINDKDYKDLLLEYLADELSNSLEYNY